MYSCSKRSGNDYVLLLLVTLLQVFFWLATKNMRPSMEIVPDLPSLTEARATALGDEQFYFRWQAFNIQNAGWTYGRSTALDEFDYRKLYYWFKLLDNLDDESSFVPALSSYYYGRAGRSEHLRYVVRYLSEYARFRLESQWHWQVEAVHIADHKLNDKDLALEMALPLLQLHNVPIIVRELPAFIYERRGEMDEARAVIEEIKGDTVLLQGEQNFMTHFLEERLKKRDPQTLYFDERKSKKRHPQ